MASAPWLRVSRISSFFKSFREICCAKKVLLYMDFTGIVSYWLRQIEPWKPRQLPLKRKGPVRLANRASINQRTDGSRLLGNSNVLGLVAFRPLFDLELHHLPLR